MAGDNEVTNEVVMVRVYLTEGDHTSKVQLAKKLLEDLHHSKKVSGATMFRGIAGFGSHYAIHEASILHPEAALPLVIEFFDTESKVQTALEYIRAFEGIRIVTWPVTVSET